MYKDGDNKDELVKDMGGIKTSQKIFKGLQPKAKKLYMERYNEIQQMDISEEMRLDLTEQLLNEKTEMNGVVRGDDKSKMRNQISH